MKHDLEKLWKLVLTDMESTVSRANFLTLFRNTALESLEDNIATIAAPSIMVIDMLQKRFTDTLRQSLSQHAGTSVDLFFIPKTVSSQRVVVKPGPLFEQPAQTKPSAIGHLPRVRAEYTFENFAVSSSNQLAFVSAQAVASHPGDTYNPFFIYGPVGVGKTHLMQAVANAVYLQAPDKKIIYMTSEEFTNEVVEAIRSNDTARMKRRFRSAFLLIIDDIQFIEGKERVQEELFHTFNILIDNGSQIVLSSDRPPQEIKKLEKRLSSRFSGGLTVDIGAPDFELKTAILLIKAKKFGFELPIEVAKVIAERAEDTRSLEGLLLRVMTQAATTGEPVNEDLALRSLGGIKEETKHRLHADDVIENVCSYYRIKPTLLKGPKRDASLVRARQITMYLLKHELHLTLVEIGNVLGGRDHTTVMHGVEKMERLLDAKAQGYEDIVGITRQLRA
jgi:chromosomal replication initiator protein